MPPLAPLPPFPKWALNPIATGETTSDPLDATLYFVPVSEGPEISDSESAVTTITMGSAKSDATLITPPPSPAIVIPRSPAKSDNSAQSPQTPVSPVSPVSLRRASAIVAEDDAARSRSNSNTSGRSTPSASSSALDVSDVPPLTRTPSQRPQRARTRSSAVLQTESTTRLGGDNTGALFHMDVISQMGPEALFMHLRHASRQVPAMREAMWGVLLDYIGAKHSDLLRLGFIQSEPELVEVHEKVGEIRRLFDGLVDRYEQ